MEVHKRSSKEIPNSSDEPIEPKSSANLPATLRRCARRDATKRIRMFLPNSSRKVEKERRCIMLRHSFSVSAAQNLSFLIISFLSPGRSSISFFVSTGLSGAHWVGRLPTGEGERGRGGRYFSITLQLFVSFNENK